jgi:hypothetical protein
MSYSNELDSNNKDLQTILETINNLPEAGGSSGPCSWNDITDKPFEDETPEPITWDGTVGDRVSMTPEGYGGTLVKVSDRIFTKDNLINSTVTFNVGQ